MGISITFSARRRTRVKARQEKRVKPSGGASEGGGGAEAKVVQQARQHTHHTHHNGEHANTNFSIFTSMASSLSVYAQCYSG